VVNFDLPNIPEDYIHRIGRTGRAGANGQALSLVSADEIKQLQDIERVLKCKIKREEIEGFEPQHALPIAKTHVPAKKPFRAQKASPNHFADKRRGQRSQNKTNHR
jgi:ATP-dependent RNA helicase RhlE